MNEKLINEVSKYLIDKYNCHSIILYGSYAKGDYTAESDIDVICFSHSAIAKNDTRLIQGIQLDAWIYSTEKMNNANDFLHISDGIIILDKYRKCNHLMDQIKKLLEEGPPEISAEEKDFLKTWLNKMFIRSQKGDVEGNYRFHWMLKDSLEIYFSLIGKWYMGPKKSLKWLEDNDKEFFSVFSKALKSSADSKEIEDLILFIKEI